MFKKTLFEVNTGSIAEIIEIKNDVLASRLANFGIQQGSKIKLINKTFTGSTLYIKTERRRMALRKNEAEKILVR